MYGHPEPVARDIQRRVYVSNETSQYGRIIKRGNKIARTALAQRTLIAIRYNAYLRRFYFKLKAKKGSGKAIIATARKLLTIVCPARPRSTERRPRTGPINLRVFRVEVIDC